MIMDHVLIVEDDMKINAYIQFLLKSNGYQYTGVASAKEAYEALIATSIDVIILDLGLPDEDGTQVMRQIRSWSDVPILVVSARNHEMEKVSVLDLGADDYMTKPFSGQELLARVRLALRHRYREHPTDPVVQIKELSVDRDKKLVKRAGVALHLTEMEYRLLDTLLQNQGKVLSSQYLIRELWGMNYGPDTQALRRLMANLRRKIEKDPAIPEFIITEIGLGYRFLD
ncbi:response regulator [Erysipelothrix aquatica]|uniref:response regulator n=1 Tax=Erysipelothrix aquatica TaxID=2683714 RepID=UPI00135C8B6B|nr:response regulator transcription factor [Erysipelothrix aquatica]